MVQLCVIGGLRLPRLNPLPPMNGLHTTVSVICGQIDIIRDKIHIASGATNELQCNCLFSPTNRESMVP